MQQPTVEENMYQERKSRNYVKMILILALIIFFILFIIVGSLRGKKYRVCKKMEHSLEEQARAYAEGKEILPTINGESVTVSVDQLVEEGYLDTNQFQMNETACGGTLKLTKVEEEYIATSDLTNCDYCTTSTRYGDWSKETTKKPRKGIIDVVAYYNYVEKETNYTKWTSYYKESKIAEEPFEKTNDKRFPSIAKEAKNIEIESEVLAYYRYRDKQWKYYKDRGGAYTDYFSSEQPSGYANKDENTRRQTEYSQWSLSYPEMKDYRDIKEATGYRWYYMDGKTKVYWNSGAYYPEQPDSTYNKKEKASAKMYSYADYEWRWYNGSKRSYSGYTSTFPSGYTARDEGLTKFSYWSSWDTTSHLNDSNRSYREEQVDNRTRYRLKYDIYSLEKLETPLVKDEFEEIVGKTLEEIQVDPNFDLITTYQYKVRK